MEYFFISCQALVTKYSVNDSVLVRAGYCSCSLGSHGAAAVVVSTHWDSTYTLKCCSINSKSTETWNEVGIPEEALDLVYSPLKQTNVGTGDGMQKSLYTDMPVEKSLLMATTDEEKKNHNHTTKEEVDSYSIDFPTSDVDGTTENSSRRLEGDVEGEQSLYEYLSNSNNNSSSNFDNNKNVIDNVKSHRVPISLHSNYNVSSEESSNLDSQQRREEKKRTGCLPLTVGCRIECQYNGGDKFYLGYIRSRNSNGTYDIRYDDGDEERGVDKKYIRIIDSSLEGDEDDIDELIYRDDGDEDSETPSVKDSKGEYHPANILLTTFSPNSTMEAYGRLSVTKDDLLLTLQHNIEDSNEFNLSPESEIRDLHGEHIASKEPSLTDVSRIVPVEELNLSTLRHAWSRDQNPHQTKYQQLRDNIHEDDNNDGVHEEPSGLSIECSTIYIRLCCITSDRLFSKYANVKKEPYENSNNISSIALGTAVEVYPTLINGYFQLVNQIGFVSKELSSGLYWEIVENNNMANVFSTESFRKLSYVRPADVLGSPIEDINIVKNEVASFHNLRRQSVSKINIIIIIIIFDMIYIYIFL